VVSRERNNESGIPRRERRRRRREKWARHGRV